MRENPQKGIIKCDVIQPERPVPILSRNKERTCTGLTVGTLLKKCRCVFFVKDLELFNF